MARAGFSLPAVVPAEGRRRLPLVSDLFWFVPGYDVHVYKAGREPLLICLLAFVLTFAGTRLYTRLARLKGWGSASSGGVHVHHLVPGILMLLISGLFFVSFRPDGFTRLLLAAVFGAGAALTLDEFALWFRLDDVYWATEGRSSVDAVVIGFVFALGCFTLASPIGVDTDSEVSRFALAVSLVLHIALIVVCVLKGKLKLGLVAIAVPGVALVGALRLAKPDSTWAKRVYGEGSHRLARARHRYAARERRWEPALERVEDLIGGTPSEP